ncbi:MAG: hypothetical protein ACYC3O_03825 [Burkholderiales bacterium]
MKRRNALPTEIPPGFVKGSAIDPATWHGKKLVVDFDGGVQCFLGYRRKKQPDDLPYFGPSVASRDPDSRKSNRFVKLSSGSIVQGGFLRDDEYYRMLEDRWLMLPSGSNSYFGVISKDKREPDDELTRAFFGGTLTEIEQVSIALARFVGRSYHENL